jgi:Na+-translocating ferredoxin:NAD+ oxidoreductase RNF subunit RnfB
MGLLKLGCSTGSSLCLTPLPTQSVVIEPRAKHHVNISRWSEVIQKAVIAQRS